jgi:DNA-binding NarL/FixJ family response regulator
VRLGAVRRTCPQGRAHRVDVHVGMAARRGLDPARETDVLAGVQAGAIGYLAKGRLTPQMLAAAVNATANGGGVVAPELLAPLLHGIARVAREQLEPRGLSLSLLTKREQRVLQLLAEGQSTHEVAVTLSYSERTVKNILHDVVIKFNARTRSQAVAHAVRAGLI